MQARRVFGTWFGPAVAAETPAAEDSLPSGWVEYHDEESGVPYYYNTITAEQVWEKPTQPAEEVNEKNGNDMKKYIIE